MVGTSDLEAAMQAYLDQTENSVNPNGEELSDEEGSERYDAIHEGYWSMRGVDHKDLTIWALEEAKRDVTSHPATQALPVAFAMQLVPLVASVYEMGIAVGFGLGVRHVNEKED